MLYSHVPGTVWGTLYVLAHLLLPTAHFVAEEIEAPFPSLATLSQIPWAAKDLRLHSEKREAAKQQSHDLNPSSCGLRSCAFEDCIIASVLSYNKGHIFALETSFAFHTTPALNLGSRFDFKNWRKLYSFLPISSPNETDEQNCQETIYL